MAKKSSSAKQALANQEASKALKMLSFAAVTLALGLVAVNYFATSLNFHRQVFSKKNEVESKLEANAEALKSLENSFKNLENNGPRPEEIFAAIPTSGDFPNTSAMLENIANRSGVEVQNINFSNESGEAAGSRDTYAEPQPAVREITLTLEINGSYGSVREVIGRLEDSRRVFRVNSVELSGTNDNVNALMGISTYFIPAVDNTIDKETFSL